MCRVYLVEISSVSPLVFKSGSFCASPGKDVASGLCSAGYYCLSGAWSPTPEDGDKTGDRCPEGHYCPQGSSAPLPCPTGYYTNRSRNAHVSDCLPCPPGWYCLISALYISLCHYLSFIYQRIQRLSNIPFIVGHCSTVFL